MEKQHRTNDKHSFHIERMKVTACCFTGHRDLPYGERFRLLNSLLANQIEVLINSGITIFVAGGAVGFDKLAANAVLKLRQRYNIKLILMLPCRNHDLKWSDSEKREYQKICAEADEIQYISELYFSGCMRKRNRAMVDASAYCIAYLVKTEGGTFYTVDYAGKKGLKIINLGERLYEGF